MKIICIGRNYADHAKEMNAEVPSEPIFFMKPDTALLKESEMYFPEFTSDLHHEVELVVKIDKAGKHISKEHADKYYSKISLGIDFTARDVQRFCKEKGLPWEKAKAFDQSAVLSNIWLDKKDLNLEDLNFSLAINNTVVQEGNSSNMIFTINELIANISKYITLKTGDLIYTGTPEGVGPVCIGDVLTGKIENQEMFQVQIR